MATGPRKRRLILVALLAAFVIVIPLSVAAWVYMLTGFGVKSRSAVLIMLGLVALGGVYAIVKVRIDAKLVDRTAERKDKPEG